MATPGSSKMGLLRLPLRSVAIWLALLLVCLGGAFAILNFTEEGRSRDLRAWQSRLHILADGRAAAVNAWLGSQYARLGELADNASLQLYLTQLALASDEGRASPSIEASRGYLYSLLLATAEREGFMAAPVGSDVAANVRRVGVSGRDGPGWSGTLSCFWVSILPQIGCLSIRDFSKESEHFLG